jgi:RimJ/RimL family protein N-acetyltransferase
MARVETTRRDLELRTDRLLLRPLTLEDAPRAAKLSNDWDVARMVSSIPFPQPAISVEGFLLIEQACRPLGQDHIFAIELPSEGLIGVSGAHLRGRDYQGREVEIGYWLGRPYWGKGYATEAATALAAFGAELGYGPVVANHFADNAASARVLQKAGFAYTGQSRMKFCLARGEAVLSLSMQRSAARGAKAA